MNLKIFLLFSVSLVSFSAAQAAAPIKVAIMDNLQSEKIASERYVADYVKGVELGVKYATTQSVSFEVKEFFFNKNPAEIVQKAREVLTWQPDVLIGPRSSDLFLMLKTIFKDTLVISPLATAAAIAEMPDNFYSITYPNDASVGVFADFVKSTFPGKSVFQLIQLDCINCKDFAMQFTRIAVERGISVRNPEPSTYISSATETFDLDSQLKAYQAGDLILLPNNSYTSGVLMGRLAEKLKTNDLNFLGSDGWGDWTVGYAGKFKSPFSYNGYRVVPWSIKKKDSETLAFSRDFRAQFNEDPGSNISLIMYSLFKSLTKVASGFDRPSKVATRERLLQSFRRLRERDSNFGRPASYAVLKVSQAGEEYIGLQPVTRSMAKKAPPTPKKKGS